MKYNELKSGMLFKSNDTSFYFPDYFAIIILDRIYLYGFYNDIITIDFLDKTHWDNISIEEDFSLVKISETEGSILGDLIRSLFELKHKAGIK